MRPLKECRIKTIHLEVRTGSARDDVIREAIALAAEEWVSVLFTFNNKEYIVNPTSIVNLITGEK